MKKTEPEDNVTMVTRLGLAGFSVESVNTFNNTHEHSLTEVVEPQLEKEQDQQMELKKKPGRSGRLYKFVKKHFLTRKNGPTNVQEIHIVPEGDDLKWARRSAGSAVSRSSGETTASEDDRLEVVHDMAEEYFPDSAL